MTAVSLSIAIAFIFFLMGDWLHRLLARGAARDCVTHFVLSSWAGVVVCLLTATTLYHATGVLAVRAFAWPVVALFAVASVCAVRLAPADKRSRVRPPWELVVVATAGLLLLSVPFFGLSGSGFYFSNNGEYINYASMADLVKYHRAQRVAATVQIVSRESVVGILCAVFSTLFNKSPFFIVQPFSNALGWLSFLSFGVVLRRVIGDWPITSRQGISAVLIYGIAILSASNQQFWTMSFLSQYLNAVIFFGVLAFCAETGDRPREHPVRDSLALGMALGAMTCAYPEMIVVSAGLVAVFYLASGQRFTQDVGPRLLVLGGAVVVAATLSNKLGFALARTYVGGAVAMSMRAGWNIFGPTEVRSLVGNLLGLSNVFAQPARPGWLMTGAVIGTILVVMLYAVFSVKTRSTPVRRGVCALAVCYFAAAAFLLVLVVAQHRETNYVAVKFMAAFVWVVFLAAASWSTSLRSGWLGMATALAWATLLVPVLSVEAAFVRNLWTTAQRVRFSERDMDAVRAEVGNASSLFVSGEPWNMKVIGMFLTYQQNLLLLWTPRPGGGAAEFVPVTRLAEFSEQEHILSVGDPERSTLGYHLTLKRETLAIWDKNPASANGVRGITSSSSYAGLNRYKPENAVDIDEKTEGVSQGPATRVTFSSNLPGTVR